MSTNFDYPFSDYCEAKNGYVCQRPAAAGAASDKNGFEYIHLSPFSLSLALYKHIDTHTHKNTNGIFFQIGLTIRPVPSP